MGVGRCGAQFCRAEKSVRRGCWCISRAKTKWRLLFGAAGWMVVSRIIQRTITQSRLDIGYCLPSLGDSPIIHKTIAAAAGRVYFQRITPWSFALVGAWKWLGLRLPLQYCCCAVHERAQRCVSLEGVGVAILCALLAGYFDVGSLPRLGYYSCHVAGCASARLAVAVVAAVLSPMYFAVPYPNADAVLAHAITLLVSIQIVVVAVVAFWF